MKLIFITILLAIASLLAHSGASSFFTTEVQETGQEPTLETIAPLAMEDIAEETREVTENEGVLTREVTHGEDIIFKPAEPTARIATGLFQEPASSAIESNLSGVVLTVLLYILNI
jgi:hypothetical protein